MANATTFTDARLEALQPRQKRFYVADDRSPGLFLRVSPGGTKAFWAKLWHDGKYRYRHLGYFPGMSVKNARDEFAQTRAVLGLNGSVAQAHAAKRITVGQAWDEYISLNPNGISPLTERNRTCHFNLHLRPALGSLWLHEVTGKEVMRVKAQMMKSYKPRTVNESLICLRLLYKWAVASGHLPENFALPTARVKSMNAGGGRTRRLHSDELRAFLDAVDDFGVLKHPLLSPGYKQTVSDALKVMLFTGARSGNVKAMRWSDINLDLGVWVVPAGQTKTNREYQIPLTSQVRDILLRRHAGPSGLGKYVFPGRGAQEHLGEIKTAFATICRRAGIDDLTVHDLRRTQGSVQADLGINMALIGEALCHSDIASTAIYTRSSGVDQLRQNMERANRAMLAQAGAEEVALTPEDWGVILSALGNHPLAAKVRALSDYARVA